MDVIEKLRGWVSDLTKFEQETFNIIKNALENEKAWILDLNAEDQLFEKGVGSDGIELASFQPYSDVTISIKRLKGQPTNRVTLRDEGDFHESFYAEFRPTEFEIYASDEKADDLKDRYGAEILGLTDESIQVLTNELIAPFLIEHFKKLAE